MPPHCTVSIYKARTVVLCIFVYPAHSPANAGAAGDRGSIPGLGRSPEGGNGNPFQSSCLGNPMDREASWATVHRGAKESVTTYRLNNNIYSPQDNS